MRKITLFQVSLAAVMREHAAGRRPPCRLRGGPVVSLLTDLSSATEIICAEHSWQRSSRAKLKNLGSDLAADEKVMCMQLSCCRGNLICFISDAVQTAECVRCTGPEST